MKNIITVLTPTYNRAYILDKAYGSLLKQTETNFEWVIVDDGSKDDTEKLVKGFIKDNKIRINYIKKENGGKHTALNVGVNNAEGEYLVMLDSDDILTPDAISLINEYSKKYKDNDKLCGFSFLKCFPNNKKIGREMKEDEIISNYIDYRQNNNMYGDMAEVFKTDVLKKYPFPVFEDERFLSEAIIWNKIALDYDTVYINKPIYIADYLEDGLSSNFFKLVYNNPLGAMNNSNTFMLKNFKLMIRIKNAILYNGYKIRAKKKYGKINTKSNSRFLTTLFYIPGVMFYIMLLHKSKK